MDFKSICRVCLEEKKGLNSLFGASVAKMLMACSSIIVIEGDGLPDQICKQCTIKASQAFRFKELCEKSDSTLREYLSSTKLTKEISEIRTDLLLADNNSLLGGHCSVFSDIFMRNDPLEPLLMDSTELTTEQFLPSLWNMRSDVDNLNKNSFYDNTLQNINVDRRDRDEWNIDLEIDNQDIDSSTYTKSYIDLDHSSRIINEDRLNNKQNDTFNCQTCGKIFTDSKSYKKHHHPGQNNLEKKYMCNICGKRYKQNKLLIIHMRVHTGERPLKCEICGKSFALPSSLHKHRQLHTGQKRHKCLFCDKTFFQVSNFNAHMRTHTGLKPFICFACGKNYSTKSDLDRHTLTHSGHRPYNCVLCEKSFRTSSLLKRHEVKHSGEKKYMCLRCGKSFSYKETYDSHLRQHTKERPFKCTLCPKTYTARNHLYRHMLTHSNDRRHQCTICDKVFMQRRHLSNHMNTHTGQRPHSCMICGRSFAHSGTLSTHMKIHKKTCDI